MGANFCFNFEIPEKNSEFFNNRQQTEQEQVEKLKKAKAEFLIPNEKELEVIFKGNLYETQNVDIADFENGKNGPSCRLLHLSEAYVENLMQNFEEYLSSASNQALKSNTDLIPTLYEGGLKIWECSLDLVNYLHKLSLEKKVDFKDKKVLELGCGAGLPGIYACLKGASVYFQDYNSEVLKLFTIPNVALNMNSGNSSIDISKNISFLDNIQSCKFLCGDWESAMLLLEPMSFDVIVTSETIYNIEAQKSLYELMKFSVKPSGVAFVAAKSYYFGVGGGTDQFSELVKRDGAFDISKLTMCSEGVKREILVMQRKQSL